jgi:cytochrome c553
MTRWTRASRIAVLLSGLVAALAGWRRTSASPAGAAVDDSWLTAIIKRWGLVAAALAALAAVGGLIVVVSGVVPMKASSGHWTITEAFLQFAKRRSIATHTLGTGVPPLDDPALILKGAGHYDFGCRPCHGSPALEQPVVAEAMLPRPPDLRDSVARYDEAALFYIVKHGLKFTGMPAWPALERDDEVWAMVAFLVRLPNLSPTDYEQLVAPAPTERETNVPFADLLPPRDTPEVIVDSCARCHGLSGGGRGTGAFPRLAGQRPAYLEASLRAFASQERHSGVMAPIAAALAPAEISAVAGYYSRLDETPVSPQAQEPTDAATRGAAIATRGVPERLVPPCEKCHGPAGPERNPIYPQLAGQYASYIELQLTLFQSRSRGGTEYHEIMERVAANLTPDDMRAVAEYYGRLPLADR